MTFVNGAPLSYYISSASVCSYVSGRGPLIFFGCFKGSVGLWLYYILEGDEEMSSVLASVVVADGGVVGESRIASGGQVVE